MEEPTQIIIVDSRRKALWSRRMFAILWPLSLIGPGVLMESAAMQWLGFIVVILAGAAMLPVVDKMRRVMTISEARSYLEELARHDR